ncbi:MAG: hypothetical protein J0I42_13380 [Bosea sp.]|uniref:hypothetical protein n=1 Tax=Bosea sp. (in: a-proteobacteria) TaxID=1871050 RepID=UPI001AC48D7D|nr:hypothetical protein [Bosea sp. (in: a-proteobacteria)]MBN9452934.1 hypothetical protein [Bosea sp. (in: a-proteobacteria)]
MSEPPDVHTTLEFYPWIVVRFDCRSCRTYRNKRLALLAEEFGASTTIEYLLGLFISNCTHRPRKRNGRTARRRRGVEGSEQALSPFRAFRPIQVRKSEWKIKQNQYVNVQK